jgi:ATP-dependent RNA helicase DDX18/HAS1
VNALDLAKVGKAFGFSIPPRININMGQTKSVDLRKRPRDEQDDTSEADDREYQENEKATQRNWKQRRTETLEKKKAHKEVYKKSADRKKIIQSDKQWSR